MDLTLEKGFKRTTNNKYWKLFCRNCFIEGDFNTAIPSICNCGKRLIILSGQSKEEINEYIKKIRSKKWKQ